MDSTAGRGGRKGPSMAATACTATPRPARRINRAVVVLSPGRPVRAAMGTPAGPSHRHRSCNSAV
jgi:hypothetical protein